MSVDDEGMEPEKSVLIKDGILKKFISDRAGELRTGHKRTGSGRRQNYSFAAASRMRNTYIAKGQTGLGSVNETCCRSIEGHLDLLIFSECMIDARQVKPEDGGPDVHRETLCF